MLKSEKALSLMELVLATGIIGIIIWGMTSSELVFYNNSKNYGSQYAVTSMTVATLNHIINNASKAVGSDGESDKGILTQTDLLQADPTFCIHQKPTSSTHQWYCYTQIGTDIYGCIRPYTASPIPPIRGAEQCTRSNRRIGGAIAETISDSNPTFDLNTLIFSITINNCFNPALSTCSQSSNPDNPYVTKSASISPPQHSYSN